MLDEVSPVILLGLPPALITKLRNTQLLTVGQLCACTAADLRELDLNSLEITEVAKSLQVNGLFLRRRRKRNSVTGNARAKRFAARVTSGISLGPNLKNAADVKRLHDLKARPVMDVTDLAWLYGVSKNTAYKVVRENGVPLRRFGDRFRILTEPIFAELFPNGIPKLDRDDL